MTIHDVCLDLIEKSKYNNRQVGEILHISTQGVANKVNKVNNNSFTERDFDKLRSYIFHLIETSIRVHINFSINEVLIIRDYINSNLEWALMEGEILNVFSKDEDLDLYFNKFEMDALIKSMNRNVMAKHQKESIEAIHKKIHVATIDLKKRLGNI